MFSVRYAGLFSELNMGKPKVATKTRLVSAMPDCSPNQDAVDEIHDLTKARLVSAMPDCSPNELEGKVNNFGFRSV